MAQEAPILPKDVREKVRSLSHRVCISTGRPKTAHDLGFDGSNYEAEMTPEDRLSQDLLPLLQIQLSKLVSCVLPTNLTDNESNRVNSIEQSYESLERTLLFFQYFICKLVGTVEGSTNALMVFRCQESHFYKRIINLNIRILISRLSEDCFEYWNSPQTRVALREEAVQCANEASDAIHALVIFLSLPILDAIIWRFQDAAGSISKLLTTESTRKKPAKDHPVIPLIKLCRLLMAKTSRRTINTHAVLSINRPDQLLDLDHQPSLIWYLVASIELLCDNMDALSKTRIPEYSGRSPDGVAEVAHYSIDRTYYHFKVFRSILQETIASSPSDIDQDFIKVFSNWLCVWYNEFFRAVMNLAFYVNADIEPEQMKYPELRGYPHRNASLSDEAPH